MNHDNAHGHATATINQTDTQERQVVPGRPTQEHASGTWSVGHHPYEATLDPIRDPLASTTNEDIERADGEGMCPVPPPRATPV